ncbi:DUF1871 family protein [Peribacillus alkalitolerans]|uniref:DUF1871 family protein n=1 Tax=Peribacillus alkalitolerans TaxID=1550385 RepID=UPI0013D174FA|nr:DUF1871 family protein [Peribacillus alkalitolerans]
MAEDLYSQVQKLLENWDPFEVGADGYETEIAECMQAIYEVDSVEELSAKIINIYEFSFGEVIKIEDAKKIAAEILLLKEQSSCS